MVWNKKKWRETKKRNDEKQKEMTRSKKKWREAISHDVSPVAMFYFVACDNKADVGTKHLFQFLHPALHLIETIEKQLGSIFDMKDIFFKPKSKINLVETVFVCYVVDKDGPCSRSIENCHNCHFYHHRDRLKRSHYHHSLHRGSLGSRSDQEHEIFLGPPCPILRGGPYIDIWYTSYWYWGEPDI